MRVENDTNDPVDYDQSGSGGGDDEEGRCKGMLTPRGTPGNGRAFAPCGPPPWSVTFVSRASGQACTTSGIANANATVRMVRFGGCQIDVGEEE